MPDPNAGLPPRYLRTPEAARFLGLSGRTLEKHRTYGTGPRYSKLGGRVVYAVTDLQTWVNRGTKASTSDDTGELMQCGRGVLRQGERRGDARSSPGLHPWQAPGLEFSDDPVGDLVVEVCAVTRGSAARSRPRRGAVHGGSP